MAYQRQLIEFVRGFALKCKVFGDGLRESGTEPFIDLTKDTGIGVAANSLARHCVQRGPNLYGKALEEVRISMAEHGQNPSIEAYWRLPDPSVYLFGNPMAFAVAREFGRSPEGIAYMWLTGEPSCSQLLEIVHETKLRQSAMCICVMLSRYELIMCTSTRRDEYGKFVRLISSSCTTAVKVVAPIPYPGLEVAAIQAAECLRAECKLSTVALLEPTEQFLIGRTARASLFNDAYSLSMKGLRHIATFLRDRSGLPLPLMIAPDQPSVKKP
uniref:Uncharacterized protein n=1 Tax=Plectus sambesii TaxID=2011161 RepID=A0A914V1V2_9BILA